MARVAVWGALQRSVIFDVAVEYRLLLVINRQHAVGRQSDKAIEELEVLAQDVSLGGHRSFVVLSMKLQRTMFVLCVEDSLYLQ